MARTSPLPRVAVGAVLIALVGTIFRAGEPAAADSSNPPTAPAPAPAAAAKPAPLPPDARPRVLRQMFPQEGFDYFTGRAGSNHNLPAMYAYRDGSGERIAVVGRGTRQDFAMSRATEAFEAYRTLLARCGYHP